VAVHKNSLQAFSGTGIWRKVYNDGLHNLYAFTDYYYGVQFKDDEITGHVARIEDMKNAYRAFVGTPEGKRTLRRPRLTKEGIIKMYLKDIGCEGVDWICLVQDRVQWRVLVNTVMKLWVP
jgi:hypothetical protein